MMTTMVLALPKPLEAHLSIEEGEARRLVEAFLGGRNARTRLAYAQDWADFAAFLGAPGASHAAHVLLSRGHGGANALVLSYRNHMADRGLASATLARRLAAIKSLVKLARMLGMVGWILDVEAPKVETYRDTRGPGRPVVRAMLDAAAARDDAKGRRDQAILRLALDLGLRRGEIVSLDVEHVDVAGRTVAILGKGRKNRETLTMPPSAADATRRWLELRGDAAGPLFLNLDRGHAGQRLTGTAVYLIVQSLGAKAGAKVRPHGLRHAAVTAALDATGGDVRQVQKFSRHRDVRTLTRYDDARHDIAGDVAKRVAAAW